MDDQDTNFNYKIILAALCAVILGVLIAFYYSYAQSKSEISFLEYEKELLVKDLTLMKTDVDRLTARDEVTDLELQSSRFKIQQLLDSVGRLTFTIERMRAFKTELSRLQAKNDSLKLKNDFLNYNNLQLVEKYEASQNEIQAIRNANAAISKAEALERDKIQEINKELKVKKYLEIETTAGIAFRMRSDGKEVQTNKASIIERLKGRVVIASDNSLANQERILYFQFLGPNMGVIEDTANTISVNGNPYSKKVSFNFSGEQTVIVDHINIPQGSLQPGDYILNVFEDEKLLQTSEFQLK